MQTGEKFRRQFKEIWVVGLTFSADGTWLGASDSQGVLHLFHAPQPQPN
jgi:hypothetical protein